jgi:putative ABC transport system substrate-binding protein
MQALGYVEGQNLTIEWRPTDGQPERYADYAAELARLPLDLLVAGGREVVMAKAVTSSMPIVTLANGDPVGQGLVDSLARPRGNVTGLSTMTLGMATKRLELLKQAVPTASRVGVLWDAATPGSSTALEWGEYRDAARVLGVELVSLDVRSANNLDRALEAAEQERVDALVFIPPLGVLRAPQIPEFAARNRLPSMALFREEVQAGALMAYGPSWPYLYRRAAYYVDRILKGAKPADLPVEQPMTFDFVINLKTAQALGLTIPEQVLLQATEVIQ